ncbi:efflux RND transporter permease subunit [Spirochaetota bacterium]
MIKVIKYLMNQKLLVNLVIILIMVAGYITVTNLNRESFPEVNFDMVTIQTIYPGGSPDEIEQLITIPIEKELREVDGLDKVRAYNIENVSVIAVFIDDKAPDKKQVVQDIKDAVDMVENLPSKAEKPLVKEIKLDKTPAVDIAVFGKKDGVSYNEIREAAKELEDYLYEIDGVADVQQFGFQDREILVEVHPRALSQYRIGMNTVINKLRNRNMDLPGGSLRINDEEFILRTKGQYNNAKEIRETVLMSNDIGYVTRIKDIAKVTSTYEDADVLERFNGQKAVIFRVWKKRSIDEIILVDNIKKQLLGYEPSNSKNVKVQLFNDQSKYTRNSISSVITNAISGLILLVLILMVLLGLRLSTIVTVGIPIAFMFAFMGMSVGGITLNVISLFGMIMVLGMIVDFSIVVSENSFRYMEEGMDKGKAIVKGVSEIFWPVTVTFFCISAAFIPLLFLSGIMGKFIMGIPIVLIICLAASWFIAMFILPTQLNIFAKVKKPKKGSGKNKNDASSRGLFGKVQVRYKSLLKIALKFRYITLLILVVLFIGSMALMSTIGFVFSPGGGAEILQIKTRLPQGTNLDANLREIRKIEKIVLKLPKSELMDLHSRAGVETSFGLDPKPGEGTHKSTVHIYLTPHKSRKRNATAILTQIRKEVLGIQKKGLLSKKMTFEFQEDEMGPPVGKPVNVEIRGKDYVTLKKIAQEYMDYLKTIKGVTDISMDFEEGKTEYRYFIKEVMASQAKVSVMDIALVITDEIIF